MHSIQSQNYIKINQNLDLQLRINLRKRMFVSLLSRLPRFMFSKITPQIFPSLKKSFEKSPQITTFGQYFIYDNAVPIFSIISQTPSITKSHKVLLLNELQAICKSNNDQQLNLLANIHRQKSIQLASMGNWNLAVTEIQAAISVIQVMEFPDEFSLGQLSRIKGDIYLKSKQFSRAVKSFRQSVNYLQHTQEDFTQLRAKDPQNKQNQVMVKNAVFGIAKSYTQLAMTFLGQNKIFQARAELAKSLQKWNELQKYVYHPNYEYTARVKCILHLLFNQKNDAIHEAYQYGKILQQKKGYMETAAKLWFMNIIVVNQKQNASLVDETEAKIINILKEHKQKLNEEMFYNLLRASGIKQEKYLQHLQQNK